MLTQMPGVGGRFGAAGPAASPAAVCRMLLCWEQGKGRGPGGLPEPPPAPVPSGAGCWKGGALSRGPGDRVLPFPRAAGTSGPCGGTAGMLLSPASTTTFWYPGSPKGASCQAGTPVLWGCGGQRDAMTAHGPCASPGAAALEAGSTGRGSGVPQLGGPPPLHCLRLSAVFP